MPLFPRCWPVTLGGVRRRHLLDVQTQVVELMVVWMYADGFIGRPPCSHRRRGATAPLRRCSCFPTGQAGPVKEPILPSELVHSQPAAAAPAPPPAPDRPRGSRPLGPQRRYRPDRQTASATEAAGSGRADRAPAADTSDRRAAAPPGPGAQPGHQHVPRPPVALSPASGMVVPACQSSPTSRRFRPTPRCRCCRPRWCRLFLAGVGLPGGARLLHVRDVHADRRRHAAAAK